MAAQRRSADGSGRVEGAASASAMCMNRAILHSTQRPSEPRKAGYALTAAPAFSPGSRAVQTRAIGCCWAWKGPLSTSASPRAAAVASAEGGEARSVGSGRAVHVAAAAECAGLAPERFACARPPMRTPRISWRSRCGGHSRRWDVPSASSHEQRTFRGQPPTLATRRLALCGQVDGGMYRPQPLRYPQGRSRGHGQTRSAFGMGLRACRACRSSPAVGARGRRRAVSSSSVWLRRPRRGPCVVPACVPSGNTSGCPEKPVDQQLHAHRPGRKLQRLGRQHRPAGRRCAVKTCNFLIRLCAAAQQAGRRTSSARPSPHTPARRLPAGAARKAAGSAGAARRTEPKSSAAAAWGSGAWRSAARAGGGGCE